MTHLLCNKSNLILHHLLVGRHTLKLESQLANGLTKSVINLGLGLNKALNKTLQARLLLSRLSRWGVGNFVLEPSGLSGIWWQGIVVPVGEIWMISLSQIVSI